MAANIPQPEPRFTGQIGSTYLDSRPDVINLPQAPEGAPNILLILLDDVGFGQTSTFGGPIDTPTLERLSKTGLRYNRFHTTACVRRLARRCCRGETITPSTQAASPSWRPASPVMTASGRARRHVSPRS